jgi:hypothetical protein
MYSPLDAARLFVATPVMSARSPLVITEVDPEYYGCLVTLTSRRAFSLGQRMSKSYPSAVAGSLLGLPLGTAHPLGGLSLRPGRAKGWIGVFSFSTRSSCTEHFVAFEVAFRQGNTIGHESLTANVWFKPARSGARP